MSKKTEPKKLISLSKKIARKYHEELSIKMSGDGIQLSRKERVMFVQDKIEKLETKFNLQDKNQDKKLALLKFPTLPVMATAEEVKYSIAHYLWTKKTLIQNKIPQTRLRKNLPRDLKLLEDKSDRFFNDTVFEETEGLSDEDFSKADAKARKKLIQAKIRIKKKIGT